MPSVRVDSRSIQRMVQGSACTNRAATGSWRGEGLRLRRMGYTTGMEATSSEAAELRRMVVQLSRLVEISVTLNSTLDRETLLRFIVASAADVLEAERAVILLADPNTRALHAVASSGASPPAAGTAIPQEGSIAGTVLRDRRPLILNEVEAGRGTLGRTPEFSDLRVRCLLAVPVVSRDRAVGVLEAANQRAGAF